MRAYILAGAIVAAASVSGCASNHLIVDEAVTAPVHAQTVKLDYQPTGAAVTEDAAAYLQRKMQEAFFGNDGGFTQGNDLTVRYRFVGFDRGSRLGRYLLGGLAGGEAEMTIQAEFVAPDGAVLGKVQAQSRVHGGFFGGSSNSAIDGAVKEIRDYALAHFR